MVFLFFQSLAKHSLLVFFFFFFFFFSDGSCFGMLSPRQLQWLLWSVSMTLVKPLISFYKIVDFPSSLMLFGDFQCVVRIDQPDIH